MASIDGHNSKESAYQNTNRTDTSTRSNLSKSWCPACDNAVSAPHPRLHSVVKGIRGETATFSGPKTNEKPNKTKSHKSLPIVRKVREQMFDTYDGDVRVFGVSGIISSDRFCDVLSRTRLDGVSAAPSRIRTASVSATA